MQQPRATEAERTLIGSTLTSSRAVDLAIEKLQVEDFYHTENKNIFKAIGNLVKNNYPVDLVSVLEQMKEDKTEKQRTGEYLTECLKMVLIADNPGFYIQKIKDVSQERKVREICAEFLQGERKKEELITHLEDIDFIKNSEVYQLGQNIEESIAHLEECQKGNKDHTGISTGFPDIDYRIGGLKKGNYMVIGGRPSHCKTLMGLNIARKVVNKYNKPILIFSFESRLEEIRDRFLYAQARVNENKARKGGSSKMWSSLVANSEKIKEMPVYVSDDVDLKPDGMRARARKFLRRHPDTCLIIVDYLQEISKSSPQQTEFESVTQASRQTNKMAKELGVPVVAMTQLNREGEKRNVIDGHRTRVLSDLRQTGQIEQDADCVLLLDYAYRNKIDEIYKNQLRGYIQKVRDGECGVVELNVIPEEKRIESKGRREP